MRLSPAKHGLDRGITLVELLIYIALMGITSTALFSVLTGNINAHDSIETTLTMNQDLRGAMSLMVRDFQEAGLNPIQVANVGFDPASTQTGQDITHPVHFWSDLNGDGVIANTGEDVSYYLGTDPENGAPALFRSTDYGNTGAPVPEVLLDYVTSFQVQYLDSDNATPIAAPSGNNVYFVNITLVAQASKKDAVWRRVTPSRTLTAKVRVRNAGT
jgi:type II secretory pathway pseudopilin PulG